MRIRTTVARLLTIIVGSASGLVAQARPDVTTDLYYLSLNACLHARAEAYKSSETLSNYSVIVQDGAEITRGFPTAVDGFRVEYLDATSLKRRYTQSKAEYPIVALAPMKNVGNFLIVNCWDYRVRVRRRRLTFGVMGGWNVQWQYDCASGKYAIVDVKRWWLQM